MTKTVKEIRKEIAELKNTNRLFRYVINDIISDSKEYDGNFAEALKSRIEDVQHGCSSGVVGSLIYYSDTTKFFKKYKNEIAELLQNLCDDCGCSPSELFGDKWDKSDIFARDTQNQNLLAWFAYEEVNNQLSYIFEM